ncbi:MAG TPA: type I-U CRISPR-associated RAMP protein Csb1/Cas7u [Stellaceae bacterium]|nr:type I-U CRISPR-associated RAMP protein Csb1/Cas7u [Stellaceae bacterium]
MDYSELVQAVASDAALRRRQRLQPVGGRGDKIFPPTYPGEGGRNPPPRHVYERRRVDGGEIWCVLIDSVQSQANRLEEALLAAVRDRAIDLPYVTVDFAGQGLDGISEITSLDAPHRVYDAILRDSLLAGEPFMKSALGVRLAEAKPNEATALLEASPTALLFGAWHSTGEGGGLGAKFPRCLVSEIVAINAPVDTPQDSNGRLRFHENDVELSWRTGPVDRVGGIEAITAGRRTGSRIDPLGVLRKVEVFKTPTGWDVTAEAAGRGAKKVRPSEINHGNIAPTVQPLGITCDYAEHTAVISFAGLRRLGFDGGERGDERNRAGRALLAALGLVALTEQDARGYALRSRCDLVCDGRAPLELVHADGGIDPVEIDVATARRLYGNAYAAARDAGFALSREPIRLAPQDKLVAIVKRSRELALEGQGGEAVDES